MENVFQNTFRNVFQNALGVGASALAGYRASTELPTFVWDANNNFYFTQVAGGTRSDHVTMTTPIITRDVDGNLKWSAHNLALNSDTPATQGVTVVSGRDYTVEITGSGSITLSGAGSGTVTAGSPVEITASTTTLTCTVVGSPSTMFVYQSDIGGMQNNPDRSDRYVPTTSVAVYKRAINYDTSNVREGMIDEPARTNLFLNSETLSTQNVTVTAVANTISFYGTGTITLTGVSTAGPLVGTGVDDKVSLTFTPTAGTLTCTVSGTVTLANCEVGSFATSSIPTQSSTVTRDVVEVSVAKANVLQIGDDVVINGGFDADTDWSKGTGWSIGSGVASCDGTQVANTILGPSSALTIVSGRTYRVTYTLSNRSAGSVKSIIGSADSALRNVDATYTDDLTASTTANLEIRGNSTFVGDIDNVMVEEVFQSEGTWVLEISGVADLAGGVLLSGASGEDVFRIGTSSAQVINDNGTTELALSSISPVLSDGGIHRMVLAFDGSGRRFSVDGNTVVSDANEYLDTSPPSAFQLLQDVAQANMPGGIMRKLTYTPQKESAAVVLALADPSTAYPS